MTAEPISLDEFSSILDPFDIKDSPIAIAVSGGADSMALALLMHESGRPIVCLTVDHRLRPESTAEADTVHAWLLARGIAHHVLTWEHDTVRGGLQQKARQARYQLLGDWCLSHHIPVLMTAHHQQDQWETFFMRLRKGSGLTGLCGIQPDRRMHFGRLIRPLLGIHPDRLRVTLGRFQQPFINDPSNENRKFERVRWRDLAPILEGVGLSADRIVRTIQRLQSVEDYIQDQTKYAMDACVVDHRIDMLRFLALPVEMAHRVLIHQIQQAGGQAYPCPHDVILRLYDKIADKNFNGATAGGCYLQRRAGGWIEITKEVRRR
ncbi:MAG: tRNA lysidine(34) synthetase TilS [Alphaproteobacteria bacterium]|nr:tRNA lysidine(34) synthetase TilS [Alphaproteobacteria bacterium]